MCLNEGQGECWTKLPKACCLESLEFLYLLVSVAEVTSSALRLLPLATRWPLWP